MTGLKLLGIRSPDLFPHFGPPGLVLPSPPQFQENTPSFSLRKIKNISTPEEAKVFEGRDAVLEAQTLRECIPTV